MEEMKNVNKTIIQDLSMEAEQKNKIMRDFVISAMDRFRKKVLMS